MINYKNPEIELIPNPIALDAAIQRIQMKLATITWIEKVFGRCVAQQGASANALDETNKAGGQYQGGRNSYVYPEVYNQREPMSLMINDNLRAYSFFHLLDPLKFTNYEAFTLGAPASQPVALIIWGNMQKIDPTKNYNFIEQLRVDVVKKLKQCSDFELSESFIGYDRVFNPFTITETFRTFLKPPYMAMRFEGTVAFDMYDPC